MKAFEHIIHYPVKGRTSKPRNVGLTMVIDKGLGLNATKDLLDVAGDYVDIVKLGFGTSRLYPESLLKEKLKLYNEYDVYSMIGGTFTEIALAQDVYDRFLEYASMLGFTAIEISDGTISIPIEFRDKIIRKSLDRGFLVISEVGKKFKELELTPDLMVEIMRRDLEAGAFKVIIEAREAGRGIGIYDEEGKIISDKLTAIVKNLDVTNIIFEAPYKSQQVELIRNFGINVNLGNIQPSDVMALEALRCGLRADTLKGIYEIPRNI